MLRSFSVRRHVQAVSRMIPYRVMNHQMKAGLAGVDHVMKMMLKAVQHVKIRRQH